MIFSGYFQIKTHRERVYAIAMLRTVYDPRLCKVEDNYQDSMVSQLYKGLALSPASISDLMSHLGRQRAAMDGFMRSMAGSGGAASFLIDGHRIISASEGMGDAALGYDSKMRHRPQINLLYVFSLGRDSVHPCYYRKFGGDISDVSAFGEVVKAAGIASGDATVIADKGFMSDGNVSLLGDLGLRYIMPLRRGNRHVRGKVPQDSAGYEESFVYAGRAVFSSRLPSEEGCNVFLYRDVDLYRDEEDDLIKRMTGWNEGLDAKKSREMQRRLRGKGQYSDAELDAMRPLRLSDVLADNPERGTISIRTDRLDLNSRQVYSIYKQRQTIEQGFKTYDDSLMGDSSYMHSDAGFEAWLFLNHLSMMMVYDAAEEIYRKGLSNKYSFDMFRKLLTKIRAMRNADGWIPCKKTKNTREMLGKLGLDISKVTMLDSHPKN